MARSDWNDDSLGKTGPSRLKVKDGQPVRITVAEDYLEVVIAHYVDGQGFIRCLAEDGQPCPLCRAALRGDKRVGKAKKRIGTRVIRYKADNVFDDEPDGNGLEVALWFFSDATFNKIKTAMLAVKGFSFKNNDLVLTCEAGKEQYQALDIKAVGNTWHKTSEAIQRQAVSKVQADRDVYALEDWSARKMSADDIAAILEGPVDDDDIEDEEEGEAPVPVRRKRPERAAAAQETDEYMSDL